MATTPNTATEEPQQWPVRSHDWPRRGEVEASDQAGQRRWTEPPGEELPSLVRPDQQRETAHAGRDHDSGETGPGGRQATGAGAVANCHVGFSICR